MATVTFDAVRKVYDNGRVAVAGATFAIASGELVVLVGPSGCGQSTLLRMIAGLEASSSGVLAIAGERSALKMKGCGLAVINPPWQFESTAAPLLDFLAPVLAQAPGGAARTVWVVKEERKESSG